MQCSTQSAKDIRVELNIPIKEILMNSMEVMTTVGEWQLIQGGGVGSGCGQLSPHAHGDSLYFSGCKMRQAVTRPLDLTRARYRYCQPSRPGTPLDVVGPLEGAVSDVVVFFLVNFLSCRKLANYVCS